MKTTRAFLENYKYLIVLISVFNFLLTPIHISVTGWHPGFIVVVNYSIIISTSSLLATSLKAKLPTYILGLLTLIFIWSEYMCPDTNSLKSGRLFMSFLLFTNFCVLLVKQLTKMKMVNLRFILGPLLGFLYLGILGGILFEATHLLDSNSFQLPINSSGYTFYYFSFISITTVGYGDVTPLTASAQSLTMILNIIGQFYLATVIGVFIGKYINIKS
ncbi:MAG: ion channel [Psychroserpens sp.]|uniref:ion channel n=1 Tax=Psychroserpens sp. TaxID=2020870 RepID=UPI003C741BA1